MAPMQSEQDILGRSPSDKLWALGMAAAEGFRCLSVAADGGPMEEVAGVPCWHSSSRVPVFSGAGLFSESHVNRETLAAVDSHFKSLGHAHSVVFLDALTPGAPALLAAQGYAEYDYMPGMWLDGPPLDRGWAHDNRPDMLIEPVETRAELATFRAILSQVFHISLAEVNLVLGDSVLAVPHVRHYLGWLGGQPVVTATVVLASGVAGIWNVGTLPNYRRRGLAARMMRHILSEARALGYDSSMLLASLEGVPLYERLGYTTLSGVRVFTPVS